MIVTGKMEILGGKPVPVPICAAQISHGLTRGRNRASAVRGRRLGAWTMALSTADWAPKTRHGHQSDTEKRRRKCCIL